MKLIVGLGNPGSEYLQTRHNIGFMVIDRLAEQMHASLSYERKLKADVVILIHNGETLIIAKPQTFMNHSGTSVAKIAQFYKIRTDDIWVVSDDLNLDFGVIRVRQGGSSGGHNGLADIIAKVGEDFGRFRVGIKNDELKRIGAESFVLQKFNKTERVKLPEIIQKTSDLISHSLEQGLKHSSHHTKGKDR